MPIGEVTTRQQYSETYKDDLFLIWFQKEQPAAHILWQMIPEEWGRKPSAATIRDWIRDIFAPKAEILNMRMKEEMADRMVKEKVEMLYRHAEVGRKMQKKALERLDTIDDAELNANASVRLLVEGIRIERDSVGLPQAMEKMLNRNDEDLLAEVERLVNKSSGKVELLDG